MDPIAAALHDVRANIEAACGRSGRNPDDVVLIGVTKLVPAERVALARAAGLTNFGENYAAELAEKAATVEATWHFIGALQSGTARVVATHASVIHSAVPGRALERVARRASDLPKTIPCLLQVDFTGRRNGVLPGAVAASLEAVEDLAGIRVIGLMTIPAWSPEPEAARPYFVRLRELRDRLHRRWPDLTELSMGMSLDYQVAVEEGATMLRIGTALFGDRPQKRSPEGAGRGSRGAKET
ncbi:MAG TPA: YggS family pyridoxal phosphate-dependent enzyme [Actinomycetota bacterium]|nr:YggS family pyridoxal phosphate-dependent enzyme [Actinomycetota bacterium]